EISGRDIVAGFAKEGKFLKPGGLVGPGKPCPGSFALGRDIGMSDWGCATPRNDPDDVFPRCISCSDIANCSPMYSVDCNELASAIAAASSEAIEKRVIGSLPIARKITSESACGIFGLMRLGGVGSVRICCIITATELSSRNGTTPVHSSYRITP